jgi:hypothetical protein
MLRHVARLFVLSVGLCLPSTTNPEPHPAGVMPHIERCASLPGGPLLRGEDGSVLYAALRGAARQDRSKTSGRIAERARRSEAPCGVVVQAPNQQWIASDANVRTPTARVKADRMKKQPSQRRFVIFSLLRNLRTALDEYNPAG